ncbi:MAG: hypothetical protein NTW09_05225 [Candidatus Omnitrophica bacterium]|nr:hypothetical protein [Candidatus Omnitrophota bacterium]
MKKNMKGILAGIAILVVGGLAINNYLAGIQVKGSAKQIAALNDLIKEKDVVINKLISGKDSKQQELDILKKELESVKTDLSNTVLKIQAQTPASPSAPVKTPVKAPVKAPVKK